MRVTIGVGLKLTTGLVEARLTSGDGGTPSNSQRERTTNENEKGKKNSGLKSFAATKVLDKNGEHEMNGFELQVAMNSNQNG